MIEVVIGISLVVALIVIYTYILTRLTVWYRNKEWMIDENKERLMVSIKIRTSGENDLLGFIDLDEDYANETLVAQIRSYLEEGQTILIEKK